MKTFKAPDKWQICRAIAVVVTVITIATLIYCIIAEIERLIGSSDALPMAIKPTKTAAVKQSNSSSTAAATTTREPPSFGNPRSIGDGAIRSFYWIRVAGMCLIVLCNAILIVGGLFYRRDFFLRIWLYLHNLALIGQLHVFIVYLVVRRMYLECLLTLCCMAWTGLFILVVFQCHELLKKRQADSIPLLPE